MTSEVIYKGELRCEMKHLQSGSIIESDAPTDNHGKGEKFSPTDLVATGTASCALTTIGIAGQTHHINIDGTKATVQKVMAANPRRIAEIHIDFYFPKNNYSDKEKAIIEHTAKTCPVAVSLSPELKLEMKFNY
jgi:putative redox protein